MRQRHFAAHRGQRVFPQQSQSAAGDVWVSACTKDLLVPWVFQGSTSQRSSNWHNQRPAPCSMQLPFLYPNVMKAAFNHTFGKLGYVFTATQQHTKDWLHCHSGVALALLGATGLTSGSESTLIHTIKHIWS